LRAGAIERFLPADRSPARLLRIWKIRKKSQENKRFAARLQFRPASIASSEKIEPEDHDRFSTSAVRHADYMIYDAPLLAKTVLYRRITDRLIRETGLQLILMQLKLDASLWLQKPPESRNINDLDAH
jgi:hypothetical protein